jgi:hypothetical protein
MRTLYRFRLLILVILAVFVRVTFAADYASANTGVQTGATLATGVLTMLDWAKRRDPDGSIPIIVELLNQTNQILTDAVFMEGNLPTGHRTTVRTGLPTIYWRLLNQAVATSKSTTAQIDEQTGLMEAWSEVDQKLAELGGKARVAGFRLSEARAFLEAMNQEWASTLFYGSALAPEEFIGLSPRYSSLSAGNADNIVDCGGTGSDNCSAWLIAWGEETCACIFPQGSAAGILHEDFGIQTITGSAGIGGTRMRAYQERYVLESGLLLKDWRHVVRCANIDVSDLTGASAADLVAFMGDAEEIIPDDMGRRAWYVPRRLKRALRKQVAKAVKDGGGLNFQNFSGQSIMAFDNTPIRTCDALTLTEARIT